MATLSTDPGVLRAARANVRRFYLYRFVAHFQLWMPIWMLYLLDERGLSLTQVLLLDGLYELMILAFEVPTGAIADRWGRKRSMTLGAIGVTIAVLLFAMSTTFWTVFGTYAVWAFATTLGSGSDVALLHDSLAAQGREGEFSRAFARGNAAAIGAIALAALVGAPLAQATSLTVPIYASLALQVGAVLVVARFHEFSPVRTVKQERYLDLVRGAFRHVARHRRLRLVLATSALVDGLGFAAIILIQPYMAHHGVEVGFFGLVLAPLGLVSMAGALSSHRLEGWLGARSTLGLAVAGCSVSLVAIGLIPSVMGLLLFGTLRFCLNVFAPIAGEAINRDSPDEVRATIASIGTMSVGIVGVLAKPVMGAAAGAWAFESAFLVAGIPLVVLGGLTTWAWIRLARPSAAIAMAGAAPAAPAEA